LSDFQALIDDKKTKEKDLQNFFVTNPEFLLLLNEKYCDLRPHVCLFDAKRERLVPDFMVRLQGSNVWDVIELKRPQHVLTTHTSGIEKVSASAARAVAELIQYRDFFGSRENRNRAKDRFGTAPYEPCLVLVIGRGRPDYRSEWRSRRAGLPKIQIVSYDYLFERARRCSAALSQPRSS